MIDELAGAKDTPEVVAVIGRAAQVLPELVPLARELGVLEGSRPVVRGLLDGGDGHGGR